MSGFMSALHKCIRGHEEIWRWSQNIMDGLNSFLLVVFTRADRVGSSQCPGVENTWVTLLKLLYFSIILAFLYLTYKNKHLYSFLTEQIGKSLLAEYVLLSWFLGTFPVPVSVYVKESSASRPRMQMPGNHNQMWRSAWHVEEVAMHFSIRDRHAGLKKKMKMMMIYV